MSNFTRRNFWKCVLTALAIDRHSFPISPPERLEKAISATLSIARESPPNESFDFLYSLRPEECREEMIFEGECGDIILVFGGEARFIISPDSAKSWIRSSPHHLWFKSLAKIFAESIKENKITV